MNKDQDETDIREMLQIGNVCKEFNITIKEIAEALDKKEMTIRMRKSRKSPLCLEELIKIYNYKKRTKKKLGDAIIKMQFIIKKVMENY